MCSTKRKKSDPSLSYNQYLFKSQCLDLVSQIKLFFNFLSQTHYKANCSECPLSFAIAATVAYGKQQLSGWLYDLGRQVAVGGGVGNC